MRTMTVFVFRISATALLACAVASTTLPGLGRSAVLCVQANDVAGLNAALATAATNDEDNTIRLQSGHYYMGSNFLIEFSSAATHDLTIEGGYADFFGDPCGLVPTYPDPYKTLLDGGQISMTMSGSGPGADGSVTLRDLTVLNVLGGPQNFGRAVAIGGNGSWGGNILIDHSVFASNSSLDTWAIFFGALYGNVSIQNSLFVSNASFGGQSPISLQDAGQGSSIGIEIINSTFAGNVSTAAAVQVWNPNALTLAANSIFWGNSGGDVKIYTPDTTYLTNDDFGNFQEIAGTQASAPVSVNPQFNTDFSLRDTSPLRDAGVSGGWGFSVGQYDIVGNPRAYGAHPDIGAYEIQDVIFAEDFE